MKPQKVFAPEVTGEKVWWSEWDKWAQKREANELWSKLIFYSVGITIIVFILSLFIFPTEWEAAGGNKVSFEERLSAFLLMDGLLLIPVPLAIVIFWLQKRFWGYDGPELVVYRKGIGVTDNFIPWANVKRIRIVSNSGLAAVMRLTGHHGFAHNASRAGTVIGIKDAAGKIRDGHVQDVAGFIAALEELGLQGKIKLTNWFINMFRPGG